MSEPVVPEILVRYPVRAELEAWDCPEGSVPESTTHDAAVYHLVRIFRNWVLRTGRNARVVRNLAIRWLPEAPRTGVDPDVCILEPAPQEAHLSSLRLWEPGRVPPRLAFEVVSESHPYKDYVNIQDRYAAFGVKELVVFDPLLAGPAKLGGPVLLQIWRLRGAGVLERVHFGDEAAYSEQLGAWLRPSTTLLEIADEREGSAFWPTGEDHERAEKEHERAEKERERAEKEHERAEKERERSARLAAESRIRELEERLSKG